MIRVLGALLILGGGGVQRWLMLREKRRARETLRELSLALETLARELRMSLAPLPRLLLRSGLGKTADAFFACVMRSYAAGGGDRPLADCWQDAVEELGLSPQDANTVVSVASAFGAQEDELASALNTAALSLRASLLERQSVQRQEEKLVTTLCLSLSILLTVLLL